MSAAVEPTETRLEVNGLAHHVICWNGGGTPVVLCHGFLDLAWSWDRVATRLAEQGYRVFAFDWRGHGETDWIGRGGYYHFPDYVLDLEDLIPQLADGPVHLVGHSMGGTACAMYAGLRPERLGTLTLVEGLGPPAHPVEYAPDKADAWLRSVAKTRRRAPRPMATVDDALRRMRMQNPELPEALGRFLAEKATRPAEGGEGIVWRFDPLHRTTSPSPFRPEVFEAFTRRITAPTLLVAGARGFRLDDEQQRAETIANRRVREIPDVGHMIHWLAPGALADVLLRFLDEA